MRYFLDTEFNGFGGDLISLGLVPEFGAHEYYAVLPLPAQLHPWVAQHVLPYLQSVPPGLIGEPIPRAAAARQLAQYFSTDPDPCVVADWPEDIAHFCMLLVTGAGEMPTVGNLSFRFLQTPGFSTAQNSRVPHNALHDARALRDFVLDGEG
jgi:hypothetical protein